MGARYNIAVVGASRLEGEAALALLGERAFPVATLFALDVAEAAGGRVEFRGGYVRVQDLAGFDFAQAAIALFFGGEAVAAEHVPRAAAAGCVVIDDSAQFRSEPAVPLVVPEVNPAAVAGYRQRHIIANPGACATLLAVALNAIRQAAGLARINVATYQAVSGAGKRAVDELAAQTTALFNMQGTSPGVFPRQIAFNVLPLIGEMLSSGYSLEEVKLAEETRKVFGDDALQVNATCVRVPVFYGHSLAVHLETREPLDAEVARVLLEKSQGVKVVDAARPPRYPTAVTEAAGSDAVFVGRVRRDLSHPRGLDLWIVADNVRRGAALNSIQIAEILVKDYLG